MQVGCSGSIGPDMIQYVNKNFVRLAVYFCQFYGYQLHFLKDPCRKEIRGGIEAVDYLTFVIFNDWFKLKNISYQQYLLASEWFTHIL